MPICESWVNKFMAIKNIEQKLRALTIRIVVETTYHKKGRMMTD